MLRIKAPNSFRHNAFVGRPLGRLTLHHLQQEFGFGRSKAKKLLAEYLNLQANNLIYDASLKGHKPSDQFTPVYTHSLFSTTSPES